MSILASDFESLIVAPGEDGERIDKLLADHFPLFSRTYFQRLLEGGFILLNGHSVKKRIIPEIGDEIEVCFQLPLESTLTPEAIPLDIIYEDETLIAINKPPGMVVHPAPGHPNGTFVNALLGHCKELAPNGDPLRPGIVHRLDKDTSGILIAAKTSLAHQKLVEAFASRQVKKTYLAICVGKPPNTLLSAPIGRHPVNRKEMAVIPEKGKEAISEIQVLAFDEKLSLVIVRPKTGRTHQIRVHLRSVNHPIVADSLYAPSRPEALGFQRLALHARSLKVQLPSGKEKAVEAPYPEDFKHALLQAGL